MAEKGTEISVSPKFPIKISPEEKRRLQNDYSIIKERHEKPIRLAGGSLGETAWKPGEPNRRVATEAGTELRKAIATEFKANRKLEAKEKELQEALTDELTGCSSRRVFYRDLDQVTENQVFQEVAISEGRLADTPDVRRTTQAIVVMIDIQGLKEVNDKHGGHQAGDKLLRAVGSKLTGRYLKTSDTKARLGGDEFVLVLKGVDKNDARAAWTRVNKALKSVALPEIGVYGITANAGFAVFDRHHPEESIKKADIAMYKAKREFYDSGGRVDILEDADNLTSEELTNPDYKSAGRGTA